jgi:hypothetical protein
MEGYEVVTTDDEKIGKVVDTQGDNLIVEHGTIRKSKHALPRTFADIDEGQQRIRMTVSKEIFCDSPKINGEVDEAAIAAHYGLAGGYEAPPTEGYGETVSDDPALGSETQAESTGVTPAPQERARTREQLPGSGEQGVQEESPALLGDHYEQSKGRR